MWTVYDHPRDCPDAFIARRFEVGRSGLVATTETMSSPHIYILREQLAIRGLTPLARSPGDDPCIIETWV